MTPEERGQYLETDTVFTPSFCGCGWGSDLRVIYEQFWSSFNCSVSFFLVCVANLFMWLIYSWLIYSYKSSLIFITDTYMYVIFSLGWFSKWNKLAYDSHVVVYSNMFMKVMHVLRAVRTSHPFWEIVFNCKKHNKTSQKFLADYIRLSPHFQNPEDGLQLFKTAPNEFKTHLRIVSCIDRLSARPMNRVLRRDRLRLVSYSITRWHHYVYAVWHYLT